LDTGMPHLTEAPWRQLTDEDIRDLPPAMIAPDERKYLTWITRELYEGRGVIADLGVFTGASTCIFGRALQRTGREAPGRIHSYDHFKVDAIMPKWLPGLDVGDSFLEIWEENARPFGDTVVCHAGDLMQESWDGTPIEIAFVDIMKGWDLGEQTAKLFFPSVIEGGLVVHQDIKFWACPWITYMMGMLREHFEPVHNAVISTIGFRCIKPVTPEGLEFPFGPDVFLNDDVIDHFEWLESYLPHGMDHSKLRGALARGFFQAGRPDAANRVLDEASESLPKPGYAYHCMPASRGFEHERPESARQRDAELLEEVEAAAAARGDTKPVALRDEAMRAKGQVEFGEEHPTIVMLSMHKAASTFIAGGFARALLRELPKLRHEPIGFRIAQEGLTPEDLPLPPQGVLATRIYPEHYDTIVEQPVPESGRFADKKLIMLRRDPRDAAVSAYYSRAFSHPVPAHGAEEFLAERERMQAVEVAEGILKYTAEPIIEEFLATETFLARHPETLLTTYEELVGDFDGWFARVAAFLDWPDELRDLIGRGLAAQVQPPAVVDPMQHRRRVTPGNWKEVFDEPLTVLFRERLGDSLVQAGYGWATGDRVGA
jgi:hypothetical protein